MKIPILLTSILLTGMLAFGGLAPERGTPLFTDSFDTPLTFAENWDPVFGPRSAAPTNGAVRLSLQLRLRRPTPANFYAEVDLTFLNDVINQQGNSRAGFGCGDGTRGWMTTTITPAGRLFVFRGQPIPGYAVGKPVRLGLQRICSEASAEYTCFVNGKVVWNGVQPLPVALQGLTLASSETWDALLAKRPDIRLAPLELYAYGVQDGVLLDNFKLFAPQSSGSPNLVANSSFEHAQDGFPLYFSRNGSFNFKRVDEMRTGIVSSYEDYLSAWRLDDKDKHSGRVSLKMVNDNRCVGGQSTMAWGVATEAGATGVISVWLKADRTNFPVRISYGGGMGSKTVVVGTEWARYETVNTNLPAKGVYSPVQIQFRNMGTLWLDDLQAEFISQPTAAELASGRTFATPYRPANADAWRFAKPVRPPRAAERRCEAPSVADSNAAPVSVLGRLSFYMDEPDAAFRVRTSLPEPEKLTAVLECAGRKVSRPAAAKFQLALPLADVPEGTNAVTVTLVDAKGGVAGRAETCLIKRPYWKGATQVNHFSRSLVHGGKPVVPVMPFWVCGRLETPASMLQELRFWEDAGFRAAHILIDNRFEGATAGFEAFASAAASNDFNIVLWTKYYDEFKTNDVGLCAMVKRLNFPSLLGQQVLDEPELTASSDWTRDFMRKMRPLFPYQPTFMNNTILCIGTDYGGFETDIQMLDDYLTNMEGRKVDSIVESVDTMWRAGTATGKPCFYFLVCGNMPLHYKEPSYGEQIAQTYGCLAAGCTGFSYFYGFPQTPGNWKAIIQLNKEIVSLTDVICSEEEVAEAACDGDAKLLRHRTFLHDGSLYIVSCNIDAFDAGTVAFTLPAGMRYANRAEVLFENRTVKIRRGAFTDEFAGHARHVYRVRLK